MKLPAEEFLKIVETTPLVSIDLILRDQADRILLGRRNNEPAKGSWFVPGGRIMKDETFPQALERIVRTELGSGIDPTIFHFRGVFEHHYETNFAQVSGISTHYVVLGYDGVTDSSETIQGDDQHSELKWFPITEAKNDDRVHANTQAYL